MGVYLIYEIALLLTILLMIISGHLLVVELLMGVGQSISEIQLLLGTFGLLTLKEII